MIPLPTNPRDATDEIQAILDSGKDVVLPEGTFYVRTSYAPPEQGATERKGIEIPPGRGIRGQDTATADGPDGHAVFERRSTLRAIPGLDTTTQAPEAPLTLGTMIVQQGDPRPEVPIQNGAFLKWQTIHGALDGIDLRAFTDQPPRSHHGVELASVDDIDLEGVRFMRCLDDGLKIDRDFVQVPVEDPLPLVVSSGGNTFSIPTVDGEGEDASAPVKEGLRSVATNHLNAGPSLRFTITLPAGATFGAGAKRRLLTHDLTLYAANATRKRAGLAPIGFLTAEDDPSGYFAWFGPPLSAYVDGGDQEPAFDAAIGWLDPISGEGYMCPGWELPAGDDLPAGAEIAVDYWTARVLSNDSPRVVNCDMDQNGRNGYTHGNHVGEASVVGLRVRGNGRAAAAVGLSGAFAADLQLGTTARYDVEVWERITARRITLTGSGEGAFKLGAEPGPVYRVGPGSYTEVTLRSCAGRGIRTLGLRCGPLTFENVEVSECEEIAMSLAHAQGTYAFDLRFDNPKVTVVPSNACCPRIDPDASLPDLTVLPDAFDPAAYQAGVRNEFVSVVGTNPARQAYVQIKAYGTILRGATNAHIVVDPGGSAAQRPCRPVDTSAPPVELYGPFVDCTFDLAPGTCVDGVEDANPCVPEKPC